MGKRYAALDRVGRFKDALADFQQMLVSGNIQRPRIIRPDWKGDGSYRFCNRLLLMSKKIPKGPNVHTLW